MDGQSRAGDQPAAARAPVTLDPRSRSLVR
jgi:hypothetical protein